jgi:hypothetical protein
MIDDAVEEVYEEYGTHILGILAFHNIIIVSEYSPYFQSHSDGALVKLLKHALNPNGRLAPGTGIWPRGFTGKCWEVFSGDSRIWSAPDSQA